MEDNMAKYNTTAYDNLYKEYAKAQDSVAATQIQQATNDANNRLREAYVTRMQNQRTLNDNLVKSGLRGGISETSNLALQTNYENSRNTINSEKLKAIQDINTATEQNKLAYKQQNDAAKQSYIEQREAEDRANAQKKAERKAKDKQAVKVDYLTAKYGKVYDIKSLNKSLKKAKTTQEKAIINARIAYLKKHSKGY